jgi:hypothetical protein
MLANALRKIYSTVDIIWIIVPDQSRHCIAVHIQLAIFASNTCQPSGSARAAHGCPAAGHLSGIGGRARLRLFPSDVHRSRRLQALVQIAAMVARMLNDPEPMALSLFPRYVLLVFRCQSLSVKCRTAPS